MPMRRRIPGRYRAFVYAVLVHLAVAAVLIIGFRWTSDPPAPQGQPVKAVAVEDPQKRKLEEDDKRRRAEEEKRRIEEARKQQEQQRQEKEEAKLRAQQQKEKEEADKKRQAEVKRKQEEERQRQAEADKKRQDAERRKQEEAERRRADAEALQQEIAAEEQARLEAARAARAASAAEKYKILIRQKVSRNWNRPPGSRTGLKCVVGVRLGPGGDVLQAKVVRSSGDVVFDRSVENAVFKAAPLPLPSEPDLFDYFRDIEFLFNPEE